MKKIPLIHGKFRAKNNPMKFHFAVFMGHEMIFMGFSREIHGIFIKLQFIVIPLLLKVNIMDTTTQHVAHKGPTNAPMFST